MNDRETRVLGTQRDGDVIQTILNLAGVTKASSCVRRDCLATRSSGWRGIKKKNVKYNLNWGSSALSTWNHFWGHVFKINHKFTHRTDDILRKTTFRYVNAKAIYIWIFQDLILFSIDLSINNTPIWKPLHYSVPKSIR